MLLEYCIRCGSCTDQRDRPSGLCPNCLEEDTMKHTPGPWKVEDCPCGDSVCRSANIWPNVVKYQGSIDRADAEHIVAIHNALEPGGIVSQLVEAAKDAQEILNPERRTYIYLSTIAQAHQRITDAIAAVEQLLEGTE